MAREQFAERVAKLLIEQIERGTAPFQKPWESTTELPHNPTTGRRYRGINALYLFAQGYVDPRWLTYRQAQELGAQVRRGATGTPIQYWQFAEERVARDERGQTIKDGSGSTVKVQAKLSRPRVFHAVVFNAEQIDGLPARAPRVLNWDPLERAEALLRDSGARIEHAPRDRAFYRLSTDSIHLPERTQFSTHDRYYATAFHELGHWTGHATRLGRDLAHPFGSEAYAREELRAEIASLLLGQELAIGHDHQNHASYVASWVSMLKRDPLELMRAAADAEKISTYVLGLSQQQTVDNTQTPALQPTVVPPAQPKHREEHFVFFWSPEPRSSELGSECLSVAYNAPFSLDGHQFHSVEHYLMYERARLAGADTTASTIVAARDAEHLKSLGFSSFAGDWPENMVDAVLTANAAKFRQNERLGQYLIDTQSSVLVAAVSDDQRWGSVDELRWGIGVDRDDARAKDRRQWQGENLLGFTLMAVRAQLQREQQLQLGSRNQEVFEHAGLRCTVEENFSAVTGETWFVGYVDLPKSHPLHGHDFVEDHALGIRVQGGITYCDHTEVGDWRVGMDSGSKPDVVRAEFTGYVRECAEQLADRVRQQEEAQMHTREDAERLQQQRHWLAVPYEEREQASARGARWDRDAKCWYAPPGADLDQLARWEPSLSADYAPPLGTREEFEDALRELGCRLGGEHPIMDGRAHRIATRDDRGREKAVFYKADLRGGYALDHRTGQEVRWRPRGKPLSSEERALARAIALREHEERERERERGYEKTAKELGAKLARYAPLVSPTPYLQTKGVSVEQGLYTDSEQRLTVIPAYDLTGKLWTLQYVRADGEKRFAAGGRQSGCFHPVGGWSVRGAAPIVILAEGYATAATIAQVSGRPTLACFNAANLVTVAAAVRERYPNKAIIIAADDDRELERKRGKNPGMQFAKQASESSRCLVIKPVFAPGEDNLTDFNDLAEVSRLGRAAVERQIGAAARAAVQDQLARARAAQLKKPQTRNTRPEDRSTRARHA